MRGVEPSLWLYALEPRRQTLGRNATCDIPVPHLTVSRVHAEIEPAADAFGIQDLTSRNGTCVNGKRISRASFAVGDVLLLGAVTLEVVPTSALPTLPDFGPQDNTTRTMPPGATVPSFGFPDLSPAQRQVLQLLLRGLSEKEVAACLHLSSHTVHAHTKNIYRALDVHSRAELLTRYLTGGVREEMPSVSPVSS
jgi:DNA-binding CsgD family transcriptional regulator